MTGPIGPGGLLGAQGLQGAQGNVGSTGAPGSAGTQGVQGIQGNSGVAGPTGGPGQNGAAGSTGQAGATGLGGPAGATGSQGTQGATGSQGTVGATGSAGTAGPIGATGIAGPTGPAGATGATGPAATADFADFYALMPPDNAATVAPGAAVAFPRNGPTSGTIVRTGTSTILLPNIGTYNVTFSVPITEAGQLVLVLNGSELANTVFGRATGASPIAGSTLIQTATVNSVLSVDNPASAAAALTVTPLAGGPDADTASLVIQELN